MYTVMPPLAVRTLVDDSAVINVTPPDWPAVPTADEPREPSSLQRAPWTDWKDIAAGRYRWEAQR